MIRDVRAPADPGDFETSLSKTASDPVEFRARAVGDILHLTVQERTLTKGRARTTGYRIIYAPSSLVAGGVVKPWQFGALADLGDTVTFISAAEDGAIQQTTVAGRSGDHGWYLCSPVGQRGVASPPVGMCRTPWGA